MQPEGASSDPEASDLQTGRVLSWRALNRALLARQMLLRRASIDPLSAVEHLVALQAQDARPPYVGLWSRIDGFHREALSRLLRNHTAVRGTLMRGTLHMVSAADYPAIRGVLQATLEKLSVGLMRDRGIDLDPARLTAESAADFEDGPHTFATIRARLGERHPGLDTTALAYAPRLRLPLLTAPTDGPWTFPGNPTFEPAERWIASPMARRANLPALIRRFLAAYGPARINDVRTWSGLTRLAPVFEAMADDLVAFQDEDGQTLYDLPDAPRPDPDTEAPARLLPEFDVAVLSYVDPRRILPPPLMDRYGSRNGRIPSRILIDGFAAGRWRVERTGRTACLTLILHRLIAPSDRRALETEGQALIRFLEPDATDPMVAFDAR
jgi:hypothetical protein